ncbi:MAG: TrmB family transcriptional regulator [Nanoarchaeota archaeon]
MEKIRQYLSEIGLTRLESDVYIALLESGERTAGKIAQNTGIHRRNVYDCLERMLQKGMVTVRKENNRALYSITDPNMILTRLQQRSQEFKEILPVLQAKFEATTDSREILFFRGTLGIRQMFEDQLSVGKEILIQATTRDVSSILSHFFPRYNRIRKEERIPIRMLFDSDGSDLPGEKGQALHEIEDLPLCQVRYIEGLNKTPMAQYVYDETVAIVVWSTNPIGIMIRQKEVAEAFRSSFGIMWEIAHAPSNNDAFCRIF